MNCSGAICVDNIFLFVDRDELVDLIGLRGFNPEDAFERMEGEDDSIGVHFEFLDVFVVEAADEVLFFEGEEHDFGHFEPQDDVLAVDLRDFLPELLEALVVDFDFELLALVESVVGEDFDDEEGHGDQLVLLVGDDLLDLGVVGLELLDRHLVAVGLFAGAIVGSEDVLDEVGDAVVFEREVDVHGEEADEGDHEVLGEVVGEDFGFDDRQLELEADEVHLVETELLLVREVVVAAEHVVELVGKGVEADAARGVGQDLLDRLVLVQQPLGGVVAVADLEHLELTRVDELQLLADLLLQLPDLTALAPHLHLDALPVRDQNGGRLLLERLLLGADLPHEVLQNRPDLVELHDLLVVDDPLDELPHHELPLLDGLRLPGLVRVLLLQGSHEHLRKQMPLHQNLLNLEKVLEPRVNPSHGAVLVDFDDVDRVELEKGLAPLGAQQLCRVELLLVLQVVGFELYHFDDLVPLAFGPEHEGVVFLGVDDLQQVLEVLHVLDLPQVQNRNQEGLLALLLRNQHQKPVVEDQHAFDGLLLLLIDAYQTDGDRCVLVDEPPGVRQVGIGVGAEEGGVLELYFPEPLGVEVLLDLRVGFVGELLDGADDVPDALVVRVRGLGVLEVLGEHDLVLAEPLDGFDHVGLETRGRVQDPTLLEDGPEGGVVFGEQLHDFVGLGVVVAVLGVVALEALLREQLLHGHRHQTLVAPVVLHGLLELVQEHVVQHVDLSDVAEQHAVHFLVVDRQFRGFQHSGDDELQLLAVRALARQHLHRSVVLPLHAPHRLLEHSLQSDAAPVFLDASGCCHVDVVVLNVRT